MPQLEWRTGLLAALLAAPAVVAALGLGTTEAYRLVQPEAPLFHNPAPQSLAQAITRGLGVEHAYAFISAGQDPNEPITFNGTEYTGGTSISVSPLMLAVAARNMNVVSMLISFGARLDLPQNSLAVCLAQDIGEEDIAEAIERYGGVDVSPDCAERRSNAPTPLLRWIE